MAVPPLVASGDLIAAAHINALRNELVSVRADSLQLTGVPDGSVGTPAVKFANELNTGIYRPQTFQMSFAVNGVKAASVGPGGMSMLSLEVNNPSDYAAIIQLTKTAGSVGKSLRLSPANNLEFMNAALNASIMVLGDTGNLFLGGLIQQESVNSFSFQNGWAAYTADPSYRPRYCRQKTGWVVLEGMIVPGTLTFGTTIATLPVGFRPDHEVVLGAMTDTGANARIDVSITGTLGYYGPTSGVAWLAIEGCSYRVAP